MHRFTPRSRPVPVALLASLLITLGCGGSPARNAESIPEQSEARSSRNRLPDANAAVEQAEELMLAGDFIRAKEVLERSLAQDASDPRAHFDLGEIAAHDERLSDAQTHYARAVELEPSFGQALNNLGLLLLDQGQAAQAVPLLERAAALRPNNPSSHYNLALALEETGAFDRAIVSYRRAVELVPEDVDALSGLGVLLAQQGDAGAADVLRRAAGLAERGESSAERGASLYRLGRALRRAGDAATARRVLQAAVRDFDAAGDVPTVVSIESALALFGVGVGSRDDALREVEALAVHHPRDASVHAAAGQMHLALGHRPQALAAFRQALAQHPDERQRQALERQIEELSH